MKFICQFTTADGLVAQEFMEFDKAPFIHLKRIVRKERPISINLNSGIPEKIEPYQTRLYELTNFSFGKSQAFYKEIT